MQTPLLVGSVFPAELSQTPRGSWGSPVSSAHQGIALYGEKLPPSSKCSPGRAKEVLGFEIGFARIFADLTSEPAASLLPFRKGQCSYSDQERGAEMHGVGGVILLPAQQ